MITSSFRPSGIHESANHRPGGSGRAGDRFASGLFLVRGTNEGACSAFIIARDAAPVGHAAVAADSTPPRRGTRVVRHGCQLPGVNEAGVRQSYGMVLP